jgi:hypothetical protein
MSTRTSFLGDPKPAAATIVYECQLIDENGAAVPASALSALTLTLVDTISGAVINSISQVNILNSGRGTVDGSGNLVVTLSPTDTALESASSAQEYRSAVIDFTYSGGKVGRHQVDFILANLAGP